VRYVLYGFPTPADPKEPPFLSDAGKRRARLVFEDDGGQWVIDRAEGPRGGPVSVRAVSGPERPDLPGELTRGVSRLAYRVVFGFGLAEMSQIDQLKGKDDDLLSRLYAASAGLRVSPPDLRARLDERADALWKKGGSAPPVNRRRTERDEARKEIRRLEGEADALRAERGRLDELDARLADAKASRTTTQTAAGALSRAAEDVERLLTQAESGEETARSKRRSLEDLRGKAASIAVDEAALAAAAGLDALASELSAFRQRLGSLANLESRLADAERNIAQLLADAGWTEPVALAAASDAGTSAEIEAARTELQDLSVRAEMASDVADRLRAETATSAPPATAVRNWLAPGIAVAAVGLSGVVAGLLSRQAPLAVFAAVIALLGILIAAVSRLLPAARSTASATARANSSTVADASGQLRAAELARSATAAALEARQGSWSQWVIDHGYGDGSEPPAAVAARWQCAREVRGAVLAREALTRDADAERAEVTAYAERVRSLAGPLTGDNPEAPVPDRAAEMLARAGDRLQAARANAAALAGLADEEERLAGDLAAAEEEAGKAHADAAARLADAGLAGSSLEDVRTAASLAETEAEEASESYDLLNRQTSELRIHVGEAERETSLAERRMDETTLTEQMAVDVREYVVLKLAALLLATAQERYERDRQPDVVKHAEAAFARMTLGRYTRITIPLGKDAIEVFDASSAAKLPDLLSRGTAEQLFLALRLGLIDQLGDVGSGVPVLIDDVLVNFSPDRVEHAAEALADLATRRQVVFFTCHPEMAELLAAVAPGATRIGLPGPAC
jgi:uncharacterized protein YhaN